MKTTMQKTVETSNRIGYGVCVMAKTAMIGFSNSFQRRTHRHYSLFGGFFAFGARHSSLFGRWCAGGFVPTGSFGQVANPHIAALFAFSNAMVGHINAKGACA